MFCYAFADLCIPRRYKVDLYHLAWKCTYQVSAKNVYL